MFPFRHVSIEVHVPGTEPASIFVTGKELGDALQYSGSYGLNSLVSLLETHARREHGRDVLKGRKIMVTSGSQDGLSKAFDMLLETDDPVLVERPTYSGALAALFPYTKNLIGIPCDADGMDVVALEKMLDEWDSVGNSGAKAKDPTLEAKEPTLEAKEPTLEAKEPTLGAKDPTLEAKEPTLEAKDLKHTHTTLKKPRVLYTIPTGQNPSGATLTKARRKELYRIACKHDLIVLEDDPYWHLRLNKDDLELPSLLSLDTEYRVLRFDSLSKVVSSGLRIGWVTGPDFLVERMQLDQQATCLHTSGLSQVAVAGLLSLWQKQGWNSHMERVRAFYRQRRDLFCDLAERILPGHLVSFDRPRAGMFCWFKVTIPHIKDTRKLIHENAVAQRILMVPGNSFEPNPEQDSTYVRASYSTASEVDMTLALERFATLLIQANEKE